MSLLLLGLEYHTVAVEAREACRFSPERICTHLQAICTRRANAQCVLIKASAPVKEAVILSTCNRLEFYTVAEGGYPLLRSWFHQIQRRIHANITSHLTVHRNQAVVEHLLRVASGLELMALGEPAILEQLADALALAQRCGTAGPLLSHLFQQAIRTGERARAETEIGHRIPNLLSAAVRVLYQRHALFAQRNTLIVGAGKMAQMVIQALQSEQGQPLAYINRTAAHTKGLARLAPGHSYPWHQMRTALTWGDAVITATAALHPILDAADIAAVLPQRRGRPLLLVDLALPRNIDPAVANVESVHLYNLSDLEWALADSAPTGFAFPESSPAWVEALPTVTQMVESEAKSIWNLIDRP